MPSRGKFEGLRFGLPTTGLRSYFTSLKCYVFAWSIGWNRFAENLGLRHIQQPAESAVQQIAGEQLLSPNLIGAMPLALSV